LMSTMKAVVLDAPRPPDAFRIQDLPILTPGPEGVCVSVGVLR
jgi:D-arabinose 1-dehydrogenase-like Zn-dependent alcohol dehydrogenase